MSNRATRCTVASSKKCDDETSAGISQYMLGGDRWLIFTRWSEIVTGFFNICWQRLTRMVGLADVADGMMTAAT
jgi:hypothetical protein